MTDKDAKPSDEQALCAQAREAAESLFGAGVIEPQGVTQVSATVRAPDQRLHVLNIGSPRVPRSVSDFFALNLARARCDAILTSAENVRREPELAHRLAGPAASALAALRRGLGKAEPPLCVILSGSGQLPLDHPVWDDGTPKVVLTHPASEAGARARLGARARVVALPQLSARGAVAWARARAVSVSVEAGPSTSIPLYASPPLVQELLLSVFEGAIDADALGKALPPDAHLLAGMRCVHEAQREEPSGRWRFQRWLRT